MLTPGPSVVSDGRLQLRHRHLDGTCSPDAPVFVCPYPRAVLPALRAKDVENPNTVARAIGHLLGAILEPLFLTEGTAPWPLAEHLRTARAGFGPQVGQ